MSNFKDPLLVLGGAVFGSLITWIVTKKVCEKNKEEEIERQVEERVASVKESYKPIIKEIQERSEANKNKPDLEKYVTTLMNSRARNSGPDISEEPIDEEDLHPPISDVPVQVSYGEFATSLNGYDKVSLYIYADDVCADDEFNVIVLDNYIGSELAEEFTSNEDVDEICVRNDNKSLYINVAKEPRTYKEAKEQS